VEEERGVLSRSGGVGKKRGKFLLVQFRAEGKRRSVKDRGLGVLPSRQKIRILGGPTRGQGRGEQSRVQGSGEFWPPRGGHAWLEGFEKKTKKKKKK